MIRVSPLVIADHLQREQGRLEAYFASTVSPDTETQSAETKACVSQESSKLLVHDTPRIPESTEEEDVTKDKLASDQVPTKALPWAHGPESNSHLHSTRGNPERNSSETKAVEEFVCEVRIDLLWWIKPCRLPPALLAPMFEMLIQPLVWITVPRSLRFFCF